MTTTIDKSTTIKSALHEGFRNGTSGMAKRKCFGYTHDADGALVVNPEEAKVVQWIFERFLDGDSLGRIAKQLQEKGIPSPSGKSIWSKEAISKLLSNEKYTGRVLLQKTVSIAGIQMKNEGFEDRYLYQRTHEAIISDEMFERVRALKQGSSITLQFS